VDDAVAFRDNFAAVDQKLGGLDEILLVALLLGLAFHDLEGTWEQSCDNVADMPPVLNERLTTQEWKVVAILQKYLQPFKIVSKQLQGRGIVSSTHARPHLARFKM